MRGGGVGGPPPPRVRPASRGPRRGIQTAVPRHDRRPRADRRTTLRFGERSGQGTVHFLHKQRR